MLAIVNSHIPPEALQRLSRLSKVVNFHADLPHYPALSGHADLFLCPTPHLLFVAPNAPAPILETLTLNHRPHRLGKTPVGDNLDSLGAYNLLVSDNFTIANPHSIDPLLAQHLSSRPLIPVRQRLCRCGAVSLGHAVLTSDGGIAKACLHESIPHLLVDPNPIQLPGYQCGCLGGCCGYHEGTLYLLGSLRHHPQGPQIAMFLKKHSITLVELYDGPLLDVGSILFV